MELFWLFKSKFLFWKEIVLSSFEDFLINFFDELWELIFEFLEAFNNSLLSNLVKEYLKLFIGLLNNFDWDKYK